MPLFDQPIDSSNEIALLRKNMQKSLPYILFSSEKHPKTSKRSISVILYNITTCKTTSLKGKLRYLRGSNYYPSVKGFCI